VLCATFDDDIMADEMAFAGSSHEVSLTAAHRTN
jgi:hypothetical protein